MTVADLVALLDLWFPPHLAEAWDNVGLLLGDPTASVARVMTCLTVTPATADESLRERADLIVSHHPIFFKPVRQLTASGGDAHLYRLAAAGVAVYSPHTAFDNADEGINAEWARRLALTAVKPLRPRLSGATMKLIVFVPESDLAKVQTAVFAAGAGVIGEYRECSFRMPGTGTFLGSDASHPTIGQKGKREEVAELRLEVLVPQSRLLEVVSAMRSAHSYETPAFDLVPLAPPPAAVGGGRMGQLPTPTTLGALATRAQAAVAAPSVTAIGDPARLCNTVAIACGAAAEYVGDAKAAGCDALLTGEARFHDQLAAEALGIGLVLVGHYASERFALETLAARLSANMPSLAVWPSRQERDPGLIVG